MDLLNDYNSAREKLFAYFGYVEGWHVYPVDDQTDMFWHISGPENGPCSSVGFAETEEEEPYCENNIMQDDCLPKSVYRGAEYTMILVDTHVDRDGNCNLR